MTPPIRMVSVPVEPTGPYSAEFGAIHHEAERGYLFSIHPESAAKEVARALNHAAAVEAAATAAPVREEGGAVAELIEAAEECLRLGNSTCEDTPENRKRCRARSRLMKLTTPKAIIAALATREEAPACKKCGGKGYTQYEGGEGEGYPSRPEIEACSCREEAPAEAGEWITGEALHEIMASFEGQADVSEIAAKINAAIALRAQPQAREEAQPVHALEIVRDPTVEGAKRFVGVTTPPAPEAEKLRVAVEALEKIASYRVTKLSCDSWADTYSGGHSAASERDADIADQALATLQQEGRK